MFCPISIFVVWLTGHAGDDESLRFFFTGHITVTFSSQVINYDARVSIDREYRLRITNVKQSDSMEGKPYACMAMNGIMRDNTQVGHRFYFIC